MFLSEQGFGMVIFVVLLFGLFVLVYEDLGFGVVLKEVCFGILFIVDFDDVNVWVKVIKRV